MKLMRMLSPNLQGFGVVQERDNEIKSQEEENCLWGLQGEERSSELKPRDWPENQVKSVAR